MKKKNIWGIMLSLVVTVAVLTVFGGIAVSADASIVESGNCGANGDNVTYTLYDDGLLVISGTGDMNSDIKDSSGVPWIDHGKSSLIKQVVIESGVTSIGSYSFFYCSNLTSITIPESVTKIDYWAFYGSGIESITIPYGVTTIGDEVFYNCDSLTSIEISSTVTSIGKKVFMACDNLTTVTFASAGDIEVIPAETFKECKELTAVYLPSGVTTIGDNAFSYCYELKTVNIPDTVTSIGNRAFYNCYNLTTAALPNSILSIGDEAFYYCQKLNFPNFPNKIKTIGNSAFYNCTGMTNALVIPDTVESLGENAFYYCENIASLTLPASDKLQFDSIPAGCFSYLKKIESVDIPSGVTSIGDSAFRGCYELSSVSLPAGVKSIGDYAFSSCSVLETIDLPDSVSSINTGAFYNTGLKTITIPDNVTKIAARTFSYCNYLKTVNIPDGVTEIGNEAFYYCPALETINIPDSVTTIGENAFEQCRLLESIDLPAGLTSLGEEAFRECRALKSIVIPNGITSIKAATFMYCTVLESVTLPNNLEYIGASAFYGCYKLTSIDLPDSLKTIGISAFGINFTDDSAGLESINLPEGVTFESDTWGNGAATFENTNITSLTIPGSITTIPENTFWYSRKLQSVTFGEGVQTIEFGALRYSNNIKTVVIPSTVTKIGMYALGSGKSMTDVYCYANPANLDMSYGNNNNFNSNTKFHVPAQYLDIYKDKFPGLADNFIGDADGEIAIGSSTHLCGHSVTIDGSIGVNFYMTLGENVLNNADTAYMQFTINGKTQNVKVSEASRDGIYYIFRCNVVAKEMTDTISAQMYLSEGNPDGDAYTYTVRDYAVYILNHKADYSTAVVNVVNEMLNYGAAAQIYFNYNTSDLANSVVNDSNKPSLTEGAYQFTDVYRIIYSDIEFVTAVGDVKLSMASLSLKSTLTLKLYFENVPEGTSFTYKGQTLKASKSGNYTIIMIEGINPYNINNWVEVGVSYGETNGTIVYNPLKYVYKVMAADYNSTITWKLKQVLSSMIDFQFALSEYYLPQP